MKEDNPSKKTAKKIIRSKVRVTQEMENAAIALGNALYTEKTVAMRLVVGLATRFADPKKVHGVMERKGYHLNRQGQKDNLYPVSIDLTLTEGLDAYIEHKAQAWEVPRVAVIRAFYQWGLENLGAFTLGDLLEAN